MGAVLIWYNPRMEKQQEYNIELMLGDITTLAVDVIVNPANKTLLSGGGLDGAIHNAAGRELWNECFTLGGCDTGEAKITKGYKLPAKHVIHTVGPVYTGAKEDPVMLERCYRNSLALVVAHDLHSIAFPAISAGAYGYPAEAAATVAVRTIRAWQEENASYDLRVIVVCFDEAMHAVYRNVMGIAT